MLQKYQVDCVQRKRQPERVVYYHFRLMNIAVFRCVNTDHAGLQAIPL